MREEERGWRLSTLRLVTDMPGEDGWTRTVCFRSFTQESRLILAAGDLFGFGPPVFIREKAGREPAMELLCQRLCASCMGFYGDCEAHTFFWLAELTRDHGWFILPVSHHVLEDDQRR